MITDALIDLLMEIGNWILMILNVPSIILSDNAKNAIEYGVEWIQKVTYFLPMQTVSEIFMIVIAFLEFKILVTIICKLWALIPFL